MKTFFLLLCIIFISISSTFSQWTLVGAVTGAGDFPSISVSDENTVFIIGGLPGQPTVFRSTDGGVNFTTLGTTGLGSIETYCGWGVDANLIFVGNGGSVNGLGGNATYYKTTNGGTNWTAIGSTGGTDGFFNGIVFSRITPMFGIAQSDPPNGPGQPYYVSTTTDSGSTWTEMDPPPPGIPGAYSCLNSIMVIDNQFFGFGVFLGASRVYMTSDGGANWFIGNLGITGNYVNGFAFSEDKMRGIAATPMALPTIARTSNGGVTWSAINTNTGITSPNWYSPCKWIPGTNICYIAGELGPNGVVAKSIDGGLTWTPMNTLGVTSISHMDFYVDGDYITGYAVTTDGRVLRLNDIVPVELTSFTANTQEGRVYLNWSTATELNNLGFEVERKIINNNKEGEWVRIGFREGYGTTTEPKEYSYLDDISSIAATSLFYRLKQIDFLGSYEYSDEVFVETLAPTYFVLRQNYPNPFNPSTTITFGVPVKANVVLKVFNSLGEEVAQLVNKEIPAGVYEVEFKAEEITSGIYFYRLQAGQFVETKKMVLLR